MSKRLNNLPNVAGAYWWVTQSLKRDMSYTTFKKLLHAERKRNPRWSANLNAAAAAASPPAPSPSAPPTPLEPAAVGAPADIAATASAPHRETCASDSVASVSASAGESSCVAGDLSPLPVDAEDLAAVSVGHQLEGAASEAVEAPRTPSMSRGASGKVLRMSPTCHRLPSMRAASPPLPTSDPAPQPPPMQQPPHMGRRLGNQLHRPKRLQAPRQLPSSARCQSALLILAGLPRLREPSMRRPPRTPRSLLLARPTRMRRGREA